MNRYINLDIAGIVERSQAWCDKKTFMAPRAQFKAGEEMSSCEKMKLNQRTWKVATIPTASLTKLPVYKL